MMILSGSPDKAEIEYPCSWNYKVIGIDAVAVKNAVAEVLGGQPYILTPSRSSSGGKYHSLNLETVVESEVRRNAIYAALKSHAAVKMVL
ncbi:MAG: DUF493 domain-containing protein [Desulfobulbaceae bacterium]|nr:DUF493 domain-containing protein [Desulfobulbaceae bacterium]